MYKLFFDRLFRICENYVYILIGIFLIFATGTIIIDSTASLYHIFEDGNILKGVLHVIDRMLLAIMAVEILYTVRISLESHVLSAEPFLIVGLIASIRRILLISVESAYDMEKFNYHMIEITILGFLIFVFVWSIRWLKKDS